MNFKFRFLPVLPSRLLPMLLLTLVLSLSARAATYVVNDTGSSESRNGCVAATACTLPGAVTAAKNDDEDSTIVFDAQVFAAPQTITLTGMALYVPKGQKLSITGPAAGAVVFADFKSTVLSIAEGAEVKLTGLTISGGKSNVGAGISNDGALTLNNVTASGNAGGGILNYGTLTLNDSTVSGDIVE